MRPDAVAVKILLDGDVDSLPQDLDLPAEVMQKLQEVGAGHARRAEHVLGDARVGEPTAPAAAGMRPCMAFARHRSCTGLGLGQWLEVLQAAVSRCQVPSEPVQRGASFCASAY